MPTTLDNLTYPFDPTGKQASNLVSNEAHVLTAANYRDYHYLVPLAAPYFCDSLVAKIKTTDGTVKPLVEGIDFYCTHVFLSASRACAARIAGSLSFLDTSLAGQVQLTYQTVGGDWTQVSAKIAEIEADALHNPRTTTWEQVVDMPVSFPVIDHDWDLADLVGMSDVVEALGTIETALRQTGSTGLADHIANTNNPHQVTAAQVGLGSVKNYGIAATSDAQAGSSDVLYMTPLKVKQAITQFALTPLNAHLADYNNPHKVDAADVGLGNVPNYAPATVADTVAGVRDDLLTTPKGVLAAINNGPGSAINTHILDTNNPHQVTANQLGVYTRTETNNLLNAKLGVNDVAANSTLLSGKTLDQVAAYVLASGQAADSAKFNGMLPADFATYVLSSGKAADSSLFNGQTPSAFSAAVLAGTAANATKFDGWSSDDYMAHVLSGKAADSTLFSGMTVQQLTNQILLSAQQQSNTAEQVGFISTTGETAAAYWQELGFAPMPKTGFNPTDFTDTHWLVSGGDAAGGVFDSMYYVHFSPRSIFNGTNNLEVRCFSGQDTGVQFGYTIENIDPYNTGTASSYLRLWAKTGKNMGELTVTALAIGAADIKDTSNRVSAEPAAIHYGTTVTYATSDQLAAMESNIESMIDSLQAAFDQLQQSVNSANS
jgi:hypothetical protein